MRLPRSAAGWTIAVFGLLALVLGLVGLIRPETLLRLLGFEVIAAGDRASGDYTRTYIAASSMAAVNMGVYYLVAAHTEWRAFFRFTVIFRLVTFSVFSTLVLTGSAPGKFFGVALWEGLGAVATGVGLWLDARRVKVTPTSPATGAVRSPTDAGR
ncbi:hypothetical protein BDK92_3910 [Micromonospora pisi]|uniref:DUF4345 domain-containing protein n=1 Tax=Micromonospora pisi TaxID=589240 RepID=A0A495JLL9_9ACTN|nr:hypothetical protein [Micromonospora pisi]RKR89555.1 hypothetical protein BDK92_3910 [Micromonospora pisi]